MEKREIFRNSNIETLKIFAIFIIILSHVIPFFWEGIPNEAYIDVRLSQNDNFQNIILIIFRYFGQIGNLIFITASSYYLQDSKKIKLKKIVLIILYTFLFSLISLIIAMLFKIDVSKKEIIKMLLPIIHYNNWFVGCYLLFYLIHPFLNILIENLSKKQLLGINIFNFIFYEVIETYINLLDVSRSYYTEIIGFIVIYFLLYYVKQYMTKFCANSKKNFKILLISFVGLLIQIIILNYLGNNWNIFYKKMISPAIIINPFIIFIGISLFNIANNRKKYCSKFINYISSLTLLIYIVHDNYFFRKYIMPDIWLYIESEFSYTYVVLESIILSIIVFIISIIICIILKLLLNQYIERISEKISSIVEKCSNKIINYLFKFE